MPTLEKAVTSLTLLLGLVAGLAGLAGLGGQDASSPATERWTADLKLSLEERKGEYVFVLEGSTTIPRAVKLRARVYAVEVVDDFQKGKREDEEPLVWEDDEGQPAFRDVTLVDGKFREEVYHFKRKPWALLYRGRIHYRPRDQSESVLKKWGDDEYSRHVDLRVGTDEEYAAQMRERVGEVTQDLVALEDLFREARRRYAAQAAKPDLAVWNAWKEGWLKKVKKINEANKLRYNLWAVWMERVARMRINGLCELLERRLIVSLESLLVEPGDKKESLQRLDELIEGYQSYYEGAIENIGLDMPLDPEKVAPLVTAYEKGYQELRTWLKTPGDPGGFAQARRDCLGALFKLPPLLSNRKRAYKHVNDLTVLFRAILDLADQDPASPALKKKLEEHDAALADFKKFAGLK
jgi:hypothetical protein